MRDLLFPTRLRRLPYFLRILPLNFLSLGMMANFDENTAIVGENLLLTLGIIAITIYAIFFIYLPRIRDCGLSPWSLVLSLIPYLSSVYGVVLLCKPSKFRFFDESEETAQDTAPAVLTVAGSDCSVCGRRLTFADEGTVTASQKVVCKDCEAKPSTPVA
jgi:uncharacterized membrane protein YhaH (DUF805 family)